MHLQARAGAEVVHAVVRTAVQADEVRGFRPARGQPAEDSPVLNPIVFQPESGGVALLDDGPFVRLGMPEDLLGLDVAGEGPRLGGELCMGARQTGEEGQYDRQAAGRRAEEETSLHSVTMSWNALHSAPCLPGSVESLLKFPRSRRFFPIALSSALGRSTGLDVNTTVRFVGAGPRACPSPRQGNHRGLPLHGGVHLCQEGILQPDMLPLPAAGHDPVQLEEIVG